MITRLRLALGALLAAAALVIGTAILGGDSASAAYEYRMVEGSRAPQGCCAAGDRLHMLMFPPTATNAGTPQTRCANAGGWLWAGNYGNGYVYLWCLDIDF